METKGASSQTQKPKVDVGRWAKHRLSTNAVRPWKELYREIVVGSASGPLRERTVGRRGRSAPIGIGR